MGGGAILNARDENPFLQDVTYVITNPAYAGLYPNYAWANLGRPRDGGVGAQGSTRVGNLSELTFVGGHFALTPRFTLGFLAGVKDSILFDQRPSTDLEALNPSLPQGTFVNPLLQTRLGTEGTNLTEDKTITNTYSVLAAWRASPSALLGLQLYSGHLASTIRQESEDPVSASSQRETRKAITGGFNLGAVLGQEQRFEIAARMRINSASREDERNAGGQTSKVAESASAAPEVSLHGRAFLPLNRRLWLVPTLRAAYFGWSTKFESNPAQDPKPGTSKYLALDLEGGVGVNLQLSRALLVGGVAASYLRDSVSFREDGNNQSTERDQSVWVLDTPKLHLGAEVQATRWLALRLGYYKRSSTVSFSESTKATVSDKVSKFNRTARDYGVPFGRLSTGNLLSMGLGIAILDFYVDATINLLDDVDQNKMLNQLSAHYVF